LLLSGYYSPKFNEENLNGRKGGEERFKVFIGFQNKVCTNMCVSTDGYLGDLRVKSINQLRAYIKLLVENYNNHMHIDSMRQLTNFGLTEQQFTNLIGRCRMYQHLPSDQKLLVPPIQFGDTQIGAVASDYYRDNRFCRDRSGNINLWKLYNLFTVANKSSYIDSFLDRSANAFCFVDQLREGLEYPGLNWFLN